MDYRFMVHTSRPLPGAPVPNPPSEEFLERAEECKEFQSFES